MELLDIQIGVNKTKSISLAHGMPVVWRFDSTDIGRPVRVTSRSTDLVCAIVSLQTSLCPLDENVSISIILIKGEENNLHARYEVVQAFLNKIVETQQDKNSKIS